MKTISFRFLFPGRNDFSLPIHVVNPSTLLLSILLFIIMILPSLFVISTFVSYLINKFVFDERSRRVRSRAKRTAPLRLLFCMSYHGIVFRNSR